MNEKTKNVISKIKSFFKETFVAPLQLIVHPISGWEIVKQEKTAKRWVSIFYVFMMIFAVIINEIGKGFIVGGTDLKEFNLFRTILVVLLPVLVGVIANWCVGSLFDGKGKASEIFDAIAYSFFPYVWLSIVATIVSNFIATDEIIYYTTQGKRVYKVITNKVIEETNWDYLQKTQDNRITLITCVENRKTYRRCVQAIEVSQNI
jgi:hypothetical protein